MKDSPNSRACSSSDHVQRIRRLIPKAVLLPTPANKKGTNVKNWPSISFEQTQCLHFRVDYGYKSALYHDEIGKAGIAVSLGRVSEGLCTIDFDTPDMAEKFFQLNPTLRETMRTCRVRGENVWFIIKGAYPRSTTLKSNAGQVGEWRADGNLTMIYGLVRDERKRETFPTAYRFISEQPPLVIEYSEIIWPPRIIPPAIEEQLILENNSSANLTIPFVCNPASLNSCTAALLYNKQAGPADWLKIHSEASKSLSEESPTLKKLYDRYIEPRFRATPGGRNEFVISSAPFLCHTVGLSVALRLMMHFYLINRRHFKATPNEHQQSCVAALKGAIKTFFLSLSDEERAVYAALERPLEQDLFRINRDLALYHSAKGGASEYFLSHDHAGERAGVEAMQAWRVQTKFVDCGLIQMGQCGQKPQKGLRSKQATSWRWLLSIKNDATASATPRDSV